MAQVEKRKPIPHEEADKKALGSRLAAARERAGYTQAAAAKELGLVNRTISAWENGRNLPDALSLRRIARLYETTSDALIGNSPAPVKWPFSADLFAKVTALEASDVLSMEVAMWAHLREPAPEAITMAASRAALQKARQLGSDVKNVTTAEERHERFSPK